MLVKDHKGPIQPTIIVLLGSLREEAQKCLPRAIFYPGIIVLRTIQ